MSTFIAMPNSFPSGCPQVTPALLPYLFLASETPILYLLHALIINVLTRLPVSTNPSQGDIWGWRTVRGENQSKRNILNPGPQRYYVFSPLFTLHADILWKAGVCCGALSQRRPPPKEFGLVHLPEPNYLLCFIMFRTLLSPLWLILKIPHLLGLPFPTGQLLKKLGFSPSTNLVLTRELVHPEVNSGPYNALSFFLLGPHTSLPADSQYQAIQTSILVMCTTYKVRLLESKIRDWPSASVTDDTSKQRRQGHGSQGHI